MIVEGGCTNPGWPPGDGRYDGGDERPAGDGWLKRVRGWLAPHRPNGKPPGDDTAL